MSTRGKISELFDLTALKAQQKEAVGYVDEFIRKAGNVKSIKIGLEGAEKTKDVLKGVTELGLATREYQRIVDATAVAQAKYNALQSEAAKVQAQVKIAVTDQNRAIKEEIQLNAAAEGSIAKKNIQLKQLQRQYDLLSETERNASGGQALLKSIQDLDKEFKELKGSTGRFQDNVGNYSGALKTLEGALGEAKKKLDDVNNSGNKNADVVKQLEKEYELLNQLVNNQANGFASATSELKNNEKALQALGAAGLQTTEFYQQLLKETAELKDNVGDLKQTIKGLASDTSALDGLVGAAQTLAGAYGIAQGAAALFGSEDKELQKTFVKLQAVMTILNGLQAIQNALQKESSVRLLITTGIQKIQLLQTNLQAAAEGRGIIVRYLAIAAQRALNAVMAVAGGPIGIVIGALALLVISLKAFGSSNESALKSLQRLNTQLEVSKSFLDEELNAIKNSNKEREAELKKRFATENELRSQSLTGQQREIESLKNYEAESADAYDKALSTFKKYHKNHKSVDEDALNEAIGIIDKYEGVNRERLNKETDLRVSLLDNQRQATVEAAAIERTELQAKIENVNLRSDLFKRISSDEFRSYEDRRKALQNFFTLQQKANALAKQQSLDNPELKNKPDERALIEAQARTKSIQLRRDQEKELRDLDRAQRERQRTSDFDSSRNAIQAAADTSQAIVNNEQKGYADRIIAADNFYNSQKALIVNQRDFDLGNEKLNSDERKNIRQKANNDLIKLQRDYGVQINDLLIAQIDKDQQVRLSADDKERDESIKALNDKFDAGKITIDEYEKKRLDMERGYSLKRLQILLEEAKVTIALYKSLGQDTSALEAAAAAIEAQISDNLTEKKIGNLKKLKDLEKQIRKDAFDLAVSFVDFAYDKEKNAIQDQIDLLDKKKEKDIEVANATITNEQEKANRISNINARANAEKEALQRRQKQADIDKAKFDKAANIAEIAVNTASAIIKQVKSTPLPLGAPLIAAVAAIGALQLARAIATPIPRYFKGTTDATGGPSWVGDGGKSESIITPGGQVYTTPNTPTLVDVPKHSVVLPDTSQLMNFLANSTHRNALAATRHKRTNQPDIGQLISREFEKNISRLGVIIENKREVNWQMKNGEWQKTIKKGMDTYNYLNDNTQF